MGEPISIVSGTASLVATTLQAGILLYNAITSFKAHRALVCDFLEELYVLIQVLSTLDGTIKTNSNIDFSTLEPTLRQCNNACKVLHTELLNCISRSNDHHTSLQDWFKLRYMGEGIDGIRQSLASCKATIDIALADANLRMTSATAEKVEACKNLLNTTKLDLENRLDTIDGKMEQMICHTNAESETDASELRLIEEERFSTRQGLRICAKLSEHINQIELTDVPGIGRDRKLHFNILPRTVIHEGLQGCRDSISRSAWKLEEYERDLFTRVMDQAKTAKASEKDRADLAWLRDEWEAARQSLKIWSTAQARLNDVIENRGVGDDFQVMLSTGEKILHGKNEALGPNIAQLGGHMNEDTAQLAIRSMEKFLCTRRVSESPPQKETDSLPVRGAVDNTDPSFKEFDAKPNHSSRTQTTPSKQMEGSLRR